MSSRRRNSSAGFARPARIARRLYGPDLSAAGAGRIAGILGPSGSGKTTLLRTLAGVQKFQALQLFPALIIPQLMLCGLFGPRDDMAGVLYAISNALPITYAVETLTELLDHPEATSHFWISLGIVAACVVALLVIAAATLRRRTDSVGRRPVASIRN